MSSISIKIVKITNPRQRQRGAAALELAFILPFLAVLIFGMIEFGVMFYDKAVITNASREGARAGITGIGNVEIQNIVENYCNNNLTNLGGDDVFDPTPDPNDTLTISMVGSNDLSVRIEYGYDLLFGSILGFNNTTISAETIMRME